MKHLFLVCLSTLILGLNGPAASDELSIRAGYSGNWYNPSQSGHGVQIEVIDQRRALVVWYTFSPTGDTVWLFGVGEIVGDSIEVTLETFGGGLFPPDFDPESITSETWGEATIRFSDCRHAEMAWTPVQAGYEDGSMPLQRLTGIEGQRCAGPERFERTVTFSLDAGPGPWEAVFADYPPGEEEFYELGSEWTTLPEPLSDRDGLMIQGNNHSDDLAMFFKAPIEGLEPGNEYDVELELTFATAVPQNCFGAGGSPGEGVYVKLGAAGVEPRPFAITEGSHEIYRFNIHKGIQSRGGNDALVVGDMTNFQAQCVPLEEREWQLKTVSTRGRDFTATTGDDGTLWVYGGTDSAFEATTVYFVTDFTARLTPLSR